MCNRMPDAPMRMAFALACCAVMLQPLQAQTPPKSAEELMRQWDLDRDGKIDAAEAEMARTRMRRARNEEMMQADVDPITGRPRAAIDVKAGRGLQPGQTASGVPAAAAGDDGGLILVPGNGEESPFAGPSPAAPPPAQPRRERDPLPGTSVPATKVPMQSVAPPSTAPGGGGRAGSPSTAAGGRSNAGGDLNSRARVLPNGLPAQPAPPQAATRPGIIAGGARPTNPASRPAAAVPSQSLNAGRLPAGLPQTRGVVPGGGSSAIGPVPRAPTQPLGPSAPGAIRGGTIRGGSQLFVPQPGGMASGGSVPPRAMVPPTGSTLPNRSGMRSPVAQPSGRTPPTGAPAVPRPPRVGPDDFYGR